MTAQQGVGDRTGGPDVARRLRERRARAHRLADLLWSPTMHAVPKRNCAALAVLPREAVVDQLQSQLRPHGASCSDDVPWLHILVRETRSMEMMQPSQDLSHDLADGPLGKPRAGTRGHRGEQIRAGCHLHDQRQKARVVHSVVYLGEIRVVDASQHLQLTQKSIAVISLLRDQPQDPRLGDVPLRAAQSGAEGAIAGKPNVASQVYAVGLVDPADELACRCASSTAFATSRQDETSRGRWRVF
mmetsp:Transcript_45368/g.145544  ORF Transcript_45368/g.145544 Transcript_45368/m.145544 type:complete len:244 (-) Transcript_45368:204-935(-)